MYFNIPAAHNPLPPYLARLKAFLDGLYFAYQRRQLIMPDPLAFVWDYDDDGDREAVGMIASSLAYGRVAQIMRDVERALEPLGPHPRDFLAEHGADEIRGLLGDFKHRFTTAADVEELYVRMGEAYRTHGSLDGLMASCREGTDSFVDSVEKFAAALQPSAERDGLSSFPLVPLPSVGSACKRLFLFIKWMVRCDDVDPGGWSSAAPAELIMPTDTHIHAISTRLALTRRKQADLRAAVEITDSMRLISQDDPTRYDFVLTRFGIRDGMSVDELVALAR